MSKEIYCVDCGKLVIILQSGSRIKPNLSIRCERCEKYISAIVYKILNEHNKKSSYDDIDMDTVFGGVFKGIFK
jgi:DNA-directed RNA polymerase subunit RPC12/RpoP